VLALNGQVLEKITVKNWNGGLDWATDRKGLFASSSTERGSATLNLDLRATPHVVWEQEGELIGLAVPALTRRAPPIHLSHFNK
jgi:hypothetical protein